MQRIYVTGNSGAGKTRLATALSAHLDLPYRSLERVIWQPGWRRTPDAERLEQEQAIAGGERWVVDGVSDTVMGAADTIVFLDVSRPRCYWQAFQRNLPYLFRSRPEFPERCPEILIVPTLLKGIWDFPMHVRPRILEACRSPGKQVIHIRRGGDLSRFLSSLRARSAGGQSAPG